MNRVDYENVKMLLSEAQIQNKILELAEVLNKEYQNEEVCLIGILNGSIMFMTELAKRLRMPLTMEFVRLSSYGSNTNSSGKVDALNMSLPNLNDKNIIIAEDIIDTGYTAKYIVDYINNNYNPKSFKFCALLNKKARREVDIEADYYCFEVDDKFIVGYGLDYDGYYRNLPYIGYLEQ